MSAIFSDAARRYRACRAEYEQYLDGVYLAAEEATRGAMLNARGRRAGIDPRSLMMGTEARALAYASPEPRRVLGGLATADLLGLRRAVAGAGIEEAPDPFGVGGFSPSGA